MITLQACPHLIELSPIFEPYISSAQDIPSKKPKKFYKKNVCFITYSNNQISLGKINYMGRLFGVPN